MAKAKKTKAQEQSLESIIMNCRDALHGTVGGNEKKCNSVMGLEFLILETVSEFSYFDLYSAKEIREN